MKAPGRRQRIQFKDQISPGPTVLRRAEVPRSLAPPITRCDVLGELHPQNVRSPLNEEKALEGKSACDGASVRTG